MPNELLIALALLLIIEGVLPFLNPQALRRLMTSMLEADDRTLRISGFLSMAIGVALLYLVH